MPAWRQNDAGEINVSIRGYSMPPRPSRAAAAAEMLRTTPPSAGRIFSLRLLDISVDIILWLSSSIFIRRAIFYTYRHYRLTREDCQDACCAITRGARGECSPPFSDIRRARALLNTSLSHTLKIASHVLGTMEQQFLC